MGYGELWNALADLSTDLKKNGIALKPEIMRDLRSAKTLMNIHEADKGYTENLTKIETLLTNVESTLILATHEKLEPELSKKWMTRIREARLAKEGESTISSRFFPGIPRGKPWIRIQISSDLPKDELMRFIKELNLSWKIGEDNWAFVWGEQNSVKEFIEKIKELVRRSD